MRCIRNTASQSTKATEPQNTLLPLRNTDPVPYTGEALQENLSDAGLFKLWRYREDFLLNESDFNVQGALITNDYKSKFSSEIRKLKDKRLSDFSFDNLLED